MKWGYLIFVILLLLPMVIPPASGDGTPIIEKNLLDVTHENRQIAMIDVHDNYEILHLFLSIVSLEPGQNITVLIPLRTAPEDIRLKNSTDWKFDWDNNITQVRRYNSMVQGGYKKFEEGYLAGAGISMLAPFVLYGGPALVLYMGMEAVGAAGSSGVTYHFKSGDTVTVYNITSVRDANEIYKKYNTTLPENVRETLQKYSTYHLLAINAKTRAPIDEKKYTLLEEKCPETMERLREYVKEHQAVKIKIIGNHIVDMPDYNYIWDTFKEESNGSWDLQDAFYWTILSIYGYGDMHGISLQLKLPLYKGTAFYPLGTSPAWNSSGEIRIWFRVPQNKEFKANHNAQMSVSYKGHRYYKWVYDSELPNYDIEGKEVDAGFGAFASDASTSFGIWLIDYGGILGMLLGCLMSIFLWIGITYIAIYAWGGKNSIMQTKNMLKLGLLTYALSLIATVVVGLFLLYYLPYNSPEKLGVQRDRNKIIKSLAVVIPILAIVFLIGAYIYYILTSIGPYQTTFSPWNFVGVIALISLLSLILPIIVVIAAIYLIRREQGKNK